MNYQDYLKNADKETQERAEFYDKRKALISYDEESKISKKTPFKFGAIRKRWGLYDRKIDILN